jgi:hypothetical protein
LWVCFSRGLLLLYVLLFVCGLLLSKALVISEHYI